jgi:hypothetical protein
LANWWVPLLVTNLLVFLWVYSSVHLCCCSLAPLLFHLSTCLLFSWRVVGGFVSWFASWRVGRRADGFSVGHWFVCFPVGLLISSLVSLFVGAFVISFVDQSVHSFTHLLLLLECPFVPVLYSSLVQDIVAAWRRFSVPFMHLKDTPLHTQIVRLT